MFVISASYGAEWKSEPSLYIHGMYNDNVGMRSTNEQSSTGNTIDPRLKLAGSEPNWDIAMDARFRFTRYNDAEDADSDSYFFDLGGSYKTERHTLKLDSYFERNNAYDTDYDTQLPDAGLVDDHTERETKSLTPSWQWKFTETSLFLMSVSAKDVQFDEVTNLAYRDYQYDSASISGIWSTGIRSQLGFTLSYSIYENEVREGVVLGVPISDFTEYDYQVYQLDYIYALSEISKLNMSLGSRRIDTTKHDQVTGCETWFIPGLSCLIPKIEDVQGKDDGVVVDLGYTLSDELSSITVSGGRTVQPSSFGGAQEQRIISFIYSRNVTERFRTKLILDASQTRSIEGLEVDDDRERFRIEPSINWKLTRDWSMGFLYRFIKQNMTETNEQSESNAIYINLSMTWPRLASTY